VENADVFTGEYEISREKFLLSRAGYIKKAKMRHKGMGVVSRRPARIHLFGNRRTSP